ISWRATKNKGEIMRQANVVVPTTGKDLPLFQRFYQSLLASDFPKDHLLTVVPPDYGLGEARKIGLETAAESAEFVLLSDTDCYLPLNPWWGKVRATFESDPKIGAVGTLVAGCPTVHLPQRIGDLPRETILTETV